MWILHIEIFNKQDGEVSNLVFDSLSDFIGSEIHVSIPSRLHLGLWIKALHLKQGRTIPEVRAPGRQILRARDPRVRSTWNSLTVIRRQMSCSLLPQMANRNIIKKQNHGTMPPMASKLHLFGPKRLLTTSIIT